MATNYQLKIIIEEPEQKPTNPTEIAVYGTRKTCESCHIEDARFVILYRHLEYHIIERTEECEICSHCWITEERIAT